MVFNVFKPKRHIFSPWVSGGYLWAVPCNITLIWSDIALSLQSGLPYVEVLCKNRYVGRTFIQPNTRLRQLGVAKKFGALSDNFSGKRVVLIDDSIVRGNTISPIIKLLREAGATEVGSMRISHLITLIK